MQLLLMITIQLTNISAQDIGYTESVYANGMSASSMLGIEDETNPLSLDKGIITQELSDFSLSSHVWTLITDYDLNFTLTALENIMISITDFGKEVEGLDWTINNPNYTFIVSNLRRAVITEKKQLDLVHHKAQELKSLYLDLINTVFITPRSRGKRSILPFGGGVLKFLFGVSTQADTKDLNDRISQFENNQRGVFHLMERQATLLKEVSEQVRTNFEATTALRDEAQQAGTFMKDLASTINELEDQLDSVHFVNRLTLSIIAFQGHDALYESILNELYQEYNAVTLGLQILARGKLASHFLPPAKLLRVLRSINNQLPSRLHLAIPLSPENLYLYYNYVKVTATSYNDALRLFISIPLKSSDRQFTLYKATPFPSPLPFNETFTFTVNPGYRYIAISSNRQRYLHLTEKEADECQKGIRVCSPNSPILQHPVISCLYALIQHKNTSACQHKVARILQPQFLRVNKPNTWVYYTANPITFTISCMDHRGSDTPELSEITIKNTGILKLPGNCSAHTEGIQIPDSYQASTIIHYQYSDVFIPRLDTLKSINIKTPIHKLKKLPTIIPGLSSLHIKPLKNIGRRIRDLKNDIKEEETRQEYAYKLKYLDISNFCQWGLWSLEIGIIVGLFIWFCVLPRSNCKTRRRKRPRPEIVYDDIREMDDLGGDQVPNAPPRKMAK